MKDVVSDTSLWGGYALDQVTAKSLSARLEILQPVNILDCGSGSSTALFAEYASRHEGVKVTSLEHDPEYVERTKLLLKDRDLGKFVKLNLCDLTVGNWYDWWPRTNTRFDFVLVDGPPGGLDGRRLALPSLWTWLAAGFELWLDDAGRENEQRALAWWLTGFPIETTPLNDRVTLVRRLRGVQMRGTS